MQESAKNQIRKNNNEVVQIGQSCWVEQRENTVNLANQNNNNGALKGYKRGIVKALKQQQNSTIVSVEFDGQDGQQVIEIQDSLVYPAASIIRDEANPNKTGNNNEQSDTEGIEDMVDLPILNKPEILNNIKIRYSRDDIFTLIGPTLIVINPYKTVPRLFSPEALQEFTLRMEKSNQDRDNNLVSKNQGQKEQSTPPHIYGIAAEAFLNLQRNGVNQSIVISGESGAGKTENAKYAMAYLAKISSFSRRANNTTENAQFIESKKTSSSADSIEDRILFCSPILEAFGNAKTVRNNNSSRFGKYVSILVERNMHTIIGALINKYLLEKSRVTRLAKDERNYHIFYHFLSSDVIPKQLGISPQPCDYKYLSSSGLYQVDSIPDQELFQEVQDSFIKMGFQADKINAIWSIIASILLLGNIEFSSKSEDAQQFTQNPDILSQLSKLLGCDNLELEKAMTVKVRKVGSDIMNSPLSLQECISVRDSLSKVLYDRLFSWLVQQLNSTINPLAVVSTKSLCIGLLDIFGFENFEQNSFEQLCINYTNEHLQQLYISYIFKNESKILCDDGLSDYMSAVSYADNQIVLDLMEKQGIFQLLRDQCSIQTGSDKSFLQSLKNKYQKEPSSKITFPMISKDSFKILHTQADVEYLVDEFVKKNKDEVNEQVDKCLRDSKNQLVQQIFAVDRGVVNSTVSSQADKFLGEKFRGQMTDLMNVLNASEVHFVRCIKPNEVKRAGCFEDGFVLQQIQYLGVLESIEVRRQMYPVRKIYSQFFESYRVIDEEYRKNNQISNDPVDLVKKLIAKHFKHFTEKVCLFGRTKIYLKLEADKELENKKADVVSELRKIARGQFMNLSIKYFNTSKQSCLSEIQRIFQKCKAILEIKKIAKNQNNLEMQFWIHKWKMQINLKKQQEFKRAQQQKEENERQQYLNSQQRLQMKLQEEQQREEQQLQSGKKLKQKDRFDTGEDPEERENRFLVSDSKSNMGLINRDDNSPDCDNVLQQQQQQFEDSNNAGMNYQSVGMDVSYASISNVKMEELRDQKRIEAMLQQEGQTKEQSDLLSQYTSIAKYYQDNKELSVLPPTQQEIDSPPLILHILEERDSFIEDDNEMVDFLNTTFNVGQQDPAIMDSFMQLKPSDILNVKLKRRRKNLFSTKTIKEVMTVQHKPISGGALTKLTAKEDKLGTEIFKDILALMEKKSEGSNGDVDLLIFSILKKCRNSSLLLKDEITLQMLKQINNNQNRIELIRVLQLMVLFTYSYKPSLDILHLALQFLFTIYLAIRDQENTDPFLNKLFSYLLNKLIKDRTRRQMEKQFPLPLFQIRFMMNLKQIHFPFFLPNGSQYSLNVDPSQTIGEVKLRLLEKIQVPFRIHPDLFGIFQILNQIDNFQEELISESEMVWDFISKFEYENQNEGNKNENNKSTQYKKQSSTCSYFFLLKVKYSYKFNPLDAVSLSFFHAQTSFDISTGKLAFSEEDIVKIGCLNIFITKERPESFDIDEILQNSQTYNEQQKLEIIKKIKKMYVEVAPFVKSRLQAKLEYISISSIYQAYMSWFVHNVQIQIEGKTISCTLSLKPNILAFIDALNMQNVLVIKTESILRQYINSEMQLIFELKADNTNRSINAISSIANSANITNAIPSADYTSNSFTPNRLILISAQASMISQYFSKYIDLTLDFNSQEQSFP